MKILLFFSIVDFVSAFKDNKSTTHGQTFLNDFVAWHETRLFAGVLIFNFWAAYSYLLLLRYCPSVFLHNALFKEYECFYSYESGFYEVEQREAYSLPP